MYRSTDRPTDNDGDHAQSSWNEDGLTIDGIQKHNSEIIGFEKNKKSNLNRRYNKPVKIIIIIMHTITRMYVTLLYTSLATFFYHCVRKAPILYYIIMKIGFSRFLRVRYLYINTLRCIIDYSLL